MKKKPDRQKPDDRADDLKKEYRFDYSKARPNRFAERMLGIAVRGMPKAVSSVGTLMGESSENYVLTEHARIAIEERRISIEWLERVLAAPAMVEGDRDLPNLKHRLGAIEEYGGRVLRVIIDVDVEPVRVVTAYFDRTMRGKL